MRRVLLVILAACGDGGADDPCAGANTACVTVTITSATVETIDNLEIDVLYGDLHGTTPTTRPGNEPIDLPIATAVAVAIDAPTPVGIVVAGKLGGNVLGTGAAQVTLGANERARVDIILAPPAGCQSDPPGNYCGGSELAGNTDTLYQCTDGVPRARGRCMHGDCVIAPPGVDDYCDGGLDDCVDTFLYCGGNKLDGDPSSLYRCSNKVGINKLVCPNGCIVQPTLPNDRCR